MARVRPTRARARRGSRPPAAGAREALCDRVLQPRRVLRRADCTAPRARPIGNDRVDSGRPNARRDARRLPRFRARAQLRPGVALGRRAASRARSREDPPPRRRRLSAAGARGARTKVPKRDRPAAHSCRRRERRPIPLRSGAGAQCRRRRAGLRHGDSFYPGERTVEPPPPRLRRPEQLRVARGRRHRVSPRAARRRRHHRSGGLSRHTQLRRLDRAGRGRHAGGGRVEAAASALRRSRPARGRLGRSGGAPGLPPQRAGGRRGPGLRKRRPAGPARPARALTAEAARSRGGALATGHPPCVLERSSIGAPRTDSSTRHPRPPSVRLVRLERRCVRRGRARSEGRRAQGNRVQDRPRVADTRISGQGGRGGEASGGRRRAQRAVRRTAEHRRPSSAQGSTSSSANRI